MAGVFDQRDRFGSVTGKPAAVFEDFWSGRVTKDVRCSSPGTDIELAWDVSPGSKLQSIIRANMNMVSNIHNRLRNLIFSDPSFLCVSRRHCILFSRKGAKTQRLGSFSFSGGNLNDTKKKAKAQNLGSHFRSELVTLSSSRVSVVHRKPISRLGPSPMALEL